MRMRARARVRAGCACVPVFVRGCARVFVCVGAGERGSAASYCCSRRVFKVKDDAGHLFAMKVVLQRIEAGSKAKAGSADSERQWQLREVRASLLAVRLLGCAPNIHCPPPAHRPAVQAKPQAAPAHRPGRRARWRAERRTQKRARGAGATPLLQPATQTPACGPSSGTSLCTRPPCGAARWQDHRWHR